MKLYMYEQIKSKTNVEYKEIFSADKFSDDNDICGKYLPVQTRVESLCCRKMSQLCEAR